MVCFVCFLFIDFVANYYGKAALNSHWDCNLKKGAFSSIHHRIKQAYIFAIFLLFFLYTWWSVSFWFARAGYITWNGEKNTAHTWNLYSEITSTNVEENTVSNRTIDH